MQDPIFKKDDLTADDFRVLRGKARIRDLYVHAPLDDSLLAHCRAAALERLVLRETNVAGPGLDNLDPSRLDTMTLDHTPLDDDGLQHLARFTQLRNLLIQNTGSGDGGLQVLRELPRLKVLCLFNLPASDAGLDALPESLQCLSIVGIPITDAAIERLAPLRSLHALYLTETNVTPAGIARLRELLPNCHYRLAPDQGIERTAEPLAYDGVFFVHPGLSRSFGPKFFGSEQ